MSYRQFAMQLSFALCEGIQIPESTAWNPEYKTLLGDLLPATKRLQAVCHATSVAGKVGWKDPKFPTHPLERSALSQIR